LTVEEKLKKKHNVKSIIYWNDLFKFKWTKFVHLFDKDASSFF